MTTQQTTQSPTPGHKLPIVVTQRKPVHSFGVEYHKLPTESGGELFVTNLGWPMLVHLLPENWYHQRWYSRKGRRLPGSTGTVYRVPTKPVAGESIDLVVKFSRVGQEVPLVVNTTLPHNATPEDVANARFSSPFEEFGLVMELRANKFGPADIRFRTQKPLAIFAPNESYEPWQLGRTQSRFHFHKQKLQKDQNTADDDQAIALDIKKTYVLLYGWAKGLDAEQAFDAGWLNENEFNKLTPQVLADLIKKGFRVLDNKPKHFIVNRRRKDNKLIRDKTNQPAYTLVDFELLQRTEEYARHYRSIKRSKYWELLSQMYENSDEPLPKHLHKTRIFGVDYAYGKTPNGAQVWIIGNSPGLIDYFYVTDRWRRTPRMQLSPISGVYRTKTRDDIYLIYRRSRIGEKPYVDPFDDAQRRLREHGYNSPFEEVAIAERLRALGLRTIYPRAIYQTGHESVKAAYMADNRRVEAFKHIKTPIGDGQPVLSANHDYYTLWGHWRGIDPLENYRKTGHWGLIDFQQALKQGLLEQQQYTTLVARTVERLENIGLTGYIADSDECLLCFEPNTSNLRRDENDELEVTLAINGLSAYDAGLLDDTQYRQLILDEADRLENTGFKPLQLRGHHLLLSINPDGIIKKDHRNKIQATLCNFEFIKMPDRYLHI